MKTTKLICFGVISTIIIFIWLISMAWASPFLVCDPQTGVETYDVELNGSVIATDHPAEADGSIRFDMFGTIDGDHSVRIKAENLWGEAWSTPFAFTKSVPQEPSGMGLSK